MRSMAALVLVGTGLTSLEAAVDLQLRTASGGVPIGGAKPGYTASLGNLNGLGAGTPSVGVTVITTAVSGGVLYATPYNIYVGGFKGGDNSVTAYVSNNFAHPSILSVWSCPIQTACSSAGGYAPMSLGAGAPTTIIPRPGVADKATSTAALGIFVANTNGAGAFTGSDSATITVVAKNWTDGLTDTVTLSLNNQTLLNVVRFTLATAPGGLTISPLADFTADYGNVNGLGVSPPAGIAATPSSGGMIYSTPYLIKPSFSGFSTTTATLKVYVSLDFTHPAILELRDAAASGGPYSAISKSSGSQTVLTTSASSGIDVTRYLGLFVSSANGSGAFVGSDNATLTYTLTAP